MTRKLSTVLLILLMSFMAQNTKAQTVWSMDFETSDSAPADWTVIENNVGDGTWIFNNPKSRTFNGSTAGNGFAIIDSDNLGSGHTQDADLISPLIDLTTASSPLMFSFEHYYKGYSNSTAIFSYSLDEGTTWIDHTTWDGSTSSAHPETVSFNLSDLLNAATSVKFKWHYEGSYSYYWCLDNIRIFTPSNMELSEVIHTSTSNAYGMIGGKLLMSELQVSTDGTLEPISSLNIYANTGETELVADIEKVMVYQGNSESIIDDPSALVGETMVTGNAFNILVNASLEASNTLYIVYQLTDAAIENDSIDIAIDSLVANDITLVPDVVNPDGMKYVRSGMQGTYTISANASDNADYESIEMAVVDLNEVGVQNNVLFEVAAGEYEAFLTIGNINGVDEDKTVTFKGMGTNPDAVVLTSNSGYAQKNTLKLDNAKYLRFENLKITTSSTNYSTLVKIVNGYKDVQFLHVSFVGVDVTMSSYSNDKHLVYDNSTDVVDEKLMFDYCDFVNGYMALSLKGQGFNKPNDKGLRIKNSSFTGQYTKSLWIQYYEDMEVCNNHFENSKDLAYEFINIDLFRCFDHVKIDANTFIDTLDVKRFSAINCRPCTGTEDNPVVISNNMIYGSSNANAYSHTIDIDDDESAYINILHNTMYLNSESGKLNGIFVEEEFDHLNIENNLIVNTSENGIAMWLKIDDVNDKTIDYNLYEIESNTFGKYGTDIIETFQAWKDSVGLEVNSDSLNISSVFVSGFNMHINTDVNLRVANPLVLVTNDIDGETRSTIEPCAGADEFSTNTSPYLELAFDTLVFDAYPDVKNVNLLHHFADAEGDTIIITVQETSNPATISTEIQEDSLLIVTRLSSEEALTEWVQLKAKSNSDSILVKMFVKLISVDQAPEIQNQIVDQNFTTYPETLTIDITGAFTDPDNEDVEMTYEVINSSYKYTSSIDGLNLNIVRQAPTAFTNETLVLKANSNGQSVEMLVRVSATAVIIDPLVADFDEMTLGTDSLWVAPNLENNYFIDKTWRFYNYTQPLWWGGFQVSSRTDVSTDGVDAQYTAVTGEGYNGSSNYAVSFAPWYETDIFPETGNLTEVVKGMYVTNNLWTYNAILNGDGMSDEPNGFGGADGNDPDYFRLLAIGFNENEEVSDTLYFYLADYRFEDNTEDYVVSDWQYFDLSELGAVSKIRFSLQSTKQNTGGMTTPAYFCMDNFNDDAPEDQAPVIQNQIAEQNFTTYPEVLTIDITDAFTDPDNEDADITYEIVSFDNTKYTATLNGMSMELVRAIPNAFVNETLVLRANSNGLSADMEISVSADAVILDLLVADFEDVILGSNGTWEATVIGDNYILDKNWRFLNNNQNNYWGGFQVSSRTDVSLDGMAAQYTAVTGEGYDASENYAVSYASSYFPAKVFPGTGNVTETVKGMYVTNNLWTYNAILNGDGMSDEPNGFGGADGNSPDYFRLLAVGYDQSNEVIDTLYFYLADYRFEDNTQDYVVSDWQYFELSELGEVSRIEFFMESTKQNSLGMTTPSYFCMDNFNGDAPMVVDLPPIVIETASVHLTQDDDFKTVDLGELVTDPDNENSEIVFTIENGADATATMSITDQVLTVERIAEHFGSTDLTIKATSNGLFVTFEIPVVVDIKTAVVNVESKTITCYPNPTSDYVYVKGIENGTYQVVSMSGTVVSEGTFNNTNQIDLTKMQSGIYQILVKDGSELIKIKVIRQ